MRAGLVVAFAALGGLLLSGCVAVHIDGGPAPAPATSGPFFKPKTGPSSPSVAPASSRTTTPGPATTPTPPSSGTQQDNVTAPPPLAVGAVGTLGVYHDVDGVPLALEPRVRGGSFHTGIYSTEPTIGVDSKDRLFVGAYTEVAVSEDRGQTFRSIFGNVAGVSTHSVSGDPYLYVDPGTDRLYQMDIDPQASAISLSWTDDVGATWTNNPDASGNPSVDDHPTMVAAKPRLLPTVGYADVIHVCFNDAVYTACSASLDGGLTFRPQVVLYAIAEPRYCGSVTGVSNGQTGHLRAGADGIVYLPTARCFASGTGYPVVAVSSDDGLTWTTHPITMAEEDLADDHDVDVAIDAQDHLYASWNSKGRILLSSSLDGGTTWTKPVNITAPGVTGTTFNAIGMLADGRVAVAYLGTTIPGGYAGKTAPTGGLAGDVTGEPDPADWAPATWNAYLTIVEGAGTAHPVLLSVTGNPLEDPLARGLCGRSRCHGMNDFIDLTVDHEGRPWASFVDVCTKECVDDPAVHFDEAQGLAVTLLEGPGPGADRLPSLPPQRQP